MPRNGWRVRSGWRILSSISLRGAFYPMENKIRLNERLKDSQRLSTLRMNWAVLSEHREMTKSEAQMELETDALES